MQKTNVTIAPNVLFTFSLSNFSFPLKLYQDNVLNLLNLREFIKISYSNKDVMQSFCETYTISVIKKLNRLKATELFYSQATQSKGGYLEFNKRDLQFYKIQQALSKGILPVVRLTDKLMQAKSLNAEECHWDWRPCSSPHSCLLWNKHAAASASETRYWKRILSSLPLPVVENLWHCVTLHDIPGTLWACEFIRFLLFWWYWWFEDLLILMLIC